ncbi:asparagine synthase-related protein [Novispirillum itersonii]|uniref:asparagine synthase (glutamine-hydrolyzing) n=1 Tax=Novispirillum itersonii TaxID=189 RepID=A0A7X0DMF8_NOVIT|nr:asparagine synthase-related protein [Novispirillum itersonii]MBB6211038.1 asparagine synthase (glutamine-hydrolyzing) [Novispirillum itersonii]
MGCLTDLTGSVSFGAEPLSPWLRERFYTSSRQDGAVALPGLHAGFLAAPHPGRRSAPKGSGGSGAADCGPAGHITLFSGFLFEREALARALDGDPAWPDARLTARWITRHGLDRLGDLAGDYALSYWNPGQRRLHLAVAPMGSRLLYWSRSGGVFHFSTTAAGLLRLPDVCRDLDPLHLTARLAAMTGDPARTVYREIHQVIPGNRLTVSPDGHRTTALWQPDLSRRLHLADDGAYLDAAEELLDRAVARRLHHARAPAFLASGGLDSSAVLTSALRLAGDDRVRAYTIVPPPGLAVQAAPGWYADETPKMQDLAAQRPALSVTLCSDDAPSPLETTPAHLFMATGLPCIIASQIGWLDIAYRRMRQAGHDVALTGQSGNFSLSYDGHLCGADLMREGHPLTALRLLWQSARYQGKAFLPTLRQTVIAPLLPDSLYYRQRRWRRMPPPLTAGPLFRPGWLDRIGLAGYLADNAEQALQERGRGSREQILHFLLKRRAMALPNTHALERIHGLEIRDIYADRDLLEFMLALPRQQFLLDGRPRSLARRLLERQGVPASITRETLAGQQRVDWNHRQTRQLAEFAADLDSFSHTPLLADMLDLPRMRQMLADWPATGPPHATMRLSHGFYFTNAIQIGRFVRWASGSNG